MSILYACATFVRNDTRAANTSAAVPCEPAPIDRNNIARAK